MKLAPIAGYATASLAALSFGTYMGMPTSNYRISSIPSNPPTLVGKVLEVAHGNGVYVALGTLGVQGKVAHKTSTLVVIEGSGDSPQSIRYALQKGNMYTLEKAPECDLAYSTSTHCVLHLYGNQISEVRTKNEQTQHTHAQTFQIQKLKPSTIKNSKKSPTS